LVGYAGLCVQHRARLHQAGIPDPRPGAADRGWLDSRDQVRRLSHLDVIDGGKVRAFSRHGWTGPKYPQVVKACAKLSCSSALIDGEIIVQDEDSLSDFDALRSVIHKALHRCEPRLELNTITQPKH
jgi:hypothetical protein